MKNYNQSRSFILGIAVDISIEAALIYNDLAYAQESFGEGRWFYRSYKQLLTRLPLMSESTARKNIRKLEETGWIKSKIMKVDGNPTLHFQIAQNLSVQNTDTMVPVKNTETLIRNSNTISNTSSAPDGAEPTKSKNLDSKKKSLLSLVNRVTGRNFRVLPERGVKKTLDAFTLVEIEKSLTALVVDPWHAERLKELSIDYFIRSTTIDKFGAKLPDTARAGGGAAGMTQDERVDKFFEEEVNSQANREMRGEA